MSRHDLTLAIGQGGGCESYPIDAMDDFGNVARRTVKVALALYALDMQLWPCGVGLEASPFLQ